ncbi:MAG: hypothetical protein SGPRY_000697 [Prymnesium sp.]
MDAFFLSFTLVSRTPSLRAARLIFPLPPWELQIVRGAFRRESAVEQADQLGVLHMLALAFLPSDEEAARSRQRHALEKPQAAAEPVKLSSGAGRSAMGE